MSYKPLTKDQVDCIIYQVDKLKKWPDLNERDPRNDVLLTFDICYRCSEECKKSPGEYNYVNNNPCPDFHYNGKVGIIDDGVRALIFTKQ